MAEEVKEEVKKKGGNVLLIAVIGILVFLLIIGGLVAFIMLGSSDENAAARQPQATTTQGPAPSPKQRSNDFFNIGPMYPMDQFLVNLLSESGSRFLKTALNLELSEETLAPEIDKKKPLIRDIIIRTLSSKTYEDVSTAKGKERLKDELVTKINETLRDGYIKNVYFTDFIVQ
ncbi:flagellar basal body-associated protein FliL [Campylobacter hyointestinalis]|uniref:Flagellar protein FliL n=1 Tax=Campylobacter hyointestinalis subsp. hyointestinalis TaxID=91352 RepID=A0A855N1T0_CAMHY|nr:flagellar basal body-associated protein FliL [Campylobacter hyointestinalis]ANE32459.1 flagellar basal body-associated protein [Campylobacter hyointestinalis subsp. hyointestinalis LMG 9260]KEA43750.1 flagellar basal body protein FliL [Campylobacter hyointestinalis subsp. hyointestinalis]MDL2346975.1 flagellar basal body-associated protein FliL [Campylobacter hyointestinalis]MDL2348412.1 flagellar basal body-associated protein FliL [Campylobacter hyointestinalis]MDL2350462.1 flagellar basal